MSGATLRTPRWTETALARLSDTTSCPLCDATLTSQRCTHCGADYRDVGGELWDASQAAVNALEARQKVLDRVARHPVGVSPRPRVETAAAPVAPADMAEPPAPAGPPRSSATVQSVLAVAGAGLVAVAAIVFTFFNPDLTDALVRGLLVGGVTLVFLVGAAALARGGLQFSAEAVGALGLVFLALDIHALTALAPADPWAAAAAATLIGGIAMAALGLRTRIRMWLWVSLVALALVPAMVGYAIGAPVVGHLAAALAAYGLIAVTDLFGRTFGAPLAGERCTLTVVELLALAVAVLQGWLFGGFAPDDLWLGVCATLAGSAVLALVSTRHVAPRLWSWLAGALGVAAVAAIPFAVAPGGDLGVWTMALCPAAAVVGAILWAVLIPIPSAAVRGILRGGALAVVFVTAVLPVATALLLGATTVLLGGVYAGAETAAAAVLGLTALAAGLVALALLEERLRPMPVALSAPAPRGIRWVGHVGLWLGALAALTLLSVPGIAPPHRVGIGLALGAAVSLSVARVRRVRRSPLAVRVPLVAGAHLLVALAAIVSWWGGLDLAATAGVAVVAAIAALAPSVPVRARFLHVGVGYAYALVVFATALSLQGVAGAALVCLTTSAGALVAISATFLPVVRANEWRAILAVTSVPFLIGVAQVVVERSGWTALSTGLIFLLALTLVLTRREGLGAPLRFAAAAVLVPSLAVMTVCLGAELLAGSGSPVVLPVIALTVAMVLPSGQLVQSVLTRRIGARDGALARIAIEASTLLTAAIAVLLALVREAAGLPTTLLVLVLLGVGGVATARWGGRRYGWPLAGAALTGALWCAWGIAGVDGIEAYLLPPALGAALVGALLTARGIPALRLYAAGLFAAVVPLVALLAVEGAEVRAAGLVAASWALLALGTMFGWSSGDRSARLGSLRAVTFAGAVVAGAAGAVEGVRLGAGLDAPLSVIPVVIECLAFAVVGAAAAALAARGLRRSSARGSAAERSQWLYAPSLAYVALGAWPAIERDWFTIWTMWVLMLCLLVALVVIAGRAVRGRTGMPPVWFVFGLAFVTAVVAWSPRELRVEWFSLPLGAALLVAGVRAMGAASAGGHRPAPRSRWAAWPAGSRGSWSLLGPGIVVALSASVAATFTDPLTWRAILVIVLALIAILVGASRRLAAPFLVGIVVLPVENAIAFAVQIGRGIESMPWWITLAVVGAVLLIIAVTYERRAGEDSGIAARLRDLA